jgi:hypothetical protein
MDAAAQPIARTAHCDSHLPPIESRALVLMSDSPAKPRIALGSDHAGFPVKETIRKYLEAAGYAVDDQGTSSEESVDYPDYGRAVGESVASKKADLGIAICGSGIGISIAANKVPGVRAALTHAHLQTVTPVTPVESALRKTAVCQRNIPSTLLRSSSRLPPSVPSSKFRIP